MWTGEFFLDQAALCAEKLDPLFSEHAHFRYQQAINRLYEVGSPDVYVVVGRTQGLADFDRVIMPLRAAGPVYKQFGSNLPAEAKSLIVRPVGAEIRNDLDSFSLREVAMTNLGASLMAGRLKILEALQICFHRLTKAV